MLLTLPRIAPQVPAEIVFDHPNSHYLRLAEAMAEAHLITPNDLAGLKCSDVRFSTVCDLIGSAWTRELRDLFTFEQLDAHVSLNLPWQNGSDGYSDSFPAAPVCSATLDSSNSPPLLLVGAVVSELEHLQEHLGVSVLAILTDALSRFCSPCTPLSAHMLASHLYWGGAANDTEAMAWYVDEDADLPKAAELFHELPAWTWVTPTPRRLPRKALVALARRYRNHRFGPLLERVAGLCPWVPGHNRGKPKATMHYADDGCAYDGESFAPPALLRWSDTDNLMRIYDDYLHAWMESGCGAPYQLFVRFSLEAEEIQEGIARIRNTGNLCQALDRALVEMAKLNE